MKIRALLFLFFWTAADASAQAAFLDELARAKSKWESQRIEDYSFVISNSCSCPDPLDKGPMLIVIEEGKLRRAIYLGEAEDGYSQGQKVRKRSMLRVSIPGLFEMIERQLKLGAVTTLKIDDKG